MRIKAMKGSPFVQFPIHTGIFGQKALQVIDRVVKNDDHFWSDDDSFIKRRCVRCYGCRKVFQTTNGEGILFWDTFCSDPFEHVFLEKFNVYADDDSFNDSLLNEKDNVDYRSEYIKGVIAKYICNPLSFDIGLTKLEYCHAILRSMQNARLKEDHEILGSPLDPFAEMKVKDLMNQLGVCLNAKFRYEGWAQLKRDKLKKDIRELFKGTSNDRV